MTMKKYICLYTVLCPTGSVTSFHHCKSILYVKSHRRARNGNKATTLYRLPSLTFHAFGTTSRKLSPDTSVQIPSTEEQASTGEIESHSQKNDTLEIGNNDLWFQPIPGLYIFEDFISKDEEDTILKQIDDASHPPDWKIEQHSGLHREKRYGIDHDMWSPTLRNAKYPLPNFMESILIPKLRTNTIPTLHDFIPNDINIIEYCRKHGHWLSQHVDDRSKHKEPIANISLAGDCYMTFKNQDSKKNKLPTEDQQIFLKQRTLLLMTGKVRYNFLHGIDNTNLLSDRRVSVTMRQTKKVPY